MLCKVLVASLLIAGTAAADPGYGPSDVQSTQAVYNLPAPSTGMWVDFGGGVERVAPGNGGVYSGHFLRFAPQTTITRHFYVGAEINIGSFDGDSVGSDAATARGTGGSTMASDGITGNLAGAKLVAGVRAIAGRISGGVELAGGIQYTELTTTMGSNDTGRGLVEARGRLDLWVTPHVTVGGMVGADLTNENNLSAGLQVGFHFVPFDFAR